MNKTPLRRAVKAKHEPQTHTQTASKTDFLLYFQTPRSTLKDLNIPSSSGKSTLFLPLTVISLLKNIPAACQQHFPCLCGCPLSSPHPQEQDEGTCRAHCVPVSEPKHNPAYCSQPHRKVIQQEEVKAPRCISLRQRVVCFN